MDGVGAIFYLGPCHASTGLFLLSMEFYVLIVSLLAGTRFSAAANPLNLLRSVKAWSFSYRSSTRDLASSPSRCDCRSRLCNMKFWLMKAAKTHVDSGSWSRGCGFRLKAGTASPFPAPPSRADPASFPCHPSPPRHLWSM